MSPPDGKEMRLRQQEPAPDSFVGARSAFHVPRRLSTLSLDTRARGGTGPILPEARLTRVLPPMPGARRPGTPCSLSLVRARREGPVSPFPTGARTLQTACHGFPTHMAISERDAAFEEWTEEIVRVLRERPEITTVELIQGFHTSGQPSARLRAVAQKRAGDGAPVPRPPPSGKRQVAA